MNGRRFDDLAKRLASPATRRNYLVGALGLITSGWIVARGGIAAQPVCKEDGEPCTLWVKCCDGRGRITVNGVPLNEGAYLAAGQRPSMIDFDVKVEEGYLWVQGDNRANSADSRVHLGDPGGGQVPVDDVVGKVFAVVWPVDHAKLLQLIGVRHSLE